MSKTNPNDLAYTGEQYADIYGNLRGPLTKRELFAKDFMAALLSNGSIKPDSTPALIANFSVAFADALIKKLNETEE